MDLWHNVPFFLLVTTLIKFVVLVVLFILPMASLLTWMERRQSAYSQDRLGPHRAHFFSLGGKPFTAGGLIHVVADATKMLFKEPFAPKAADLFVFRLAPAIGFIASICIVSMVPFGPDLHTSWDAPWNVIPLQLVRVDTGLLLVLALGGVGIYGTALAGWSSSNKFALLGGLRASAQTISYEIALGLTLVGILMLAGTAELNHWVLAQTGTDASGFLPKWGIFWQPLGALLYLVAGMAETKRAPFDMPEGESEIVGYFLEYSSMGFGLFMLGEFVEVVVLAALFSTLFFGGWQVPYLTSAEGLQLGSFTLASGSWLFALVGMATFAFKTFLLAALQLQIRWTLVRFRYDQLMRLGWKNLLPLALVNIVVTAGLLTYDPSANLLFRCGVLFWFVFAGIVVAGPKRRLTSSPSHGHAAHAVPGALGASHGH